LRAAHAAGVLHRDVKPGNVLLSESGRVVLTDFGIAQASGTSTLTRTGELIGSVDFLAPERLTGGAPGPEADLWALGATLFQAVEGRSPFRRDTAIETAYAIATDEVPVAGRAGPLGPVIAGLLVRDPERRLSAVEAERMLRASAAETASVPRDGLTSPTGPAPAGRPRSTGTATGPMPLRPRRRAPLWTAAVLVPALAGGVVYAVPHFGDGHRGTASAPPSPPVVTTPGTPSASVHPAAAAPSASPAPTYTPPPVPAGYHLVAERDRGFSVPVPDGWKRQVSDDGRQFVYVDPTGLVGLRVAALDFAGPSPLGHFEDVEEQMVPDLEGYERLRMQSTRWRGRPAAVWEFTFKGTARDFRAVDLGFGQPGEQEFTVYLSAPSDRWGSYRAVFDNAVAGLRLDD
jgi:hypothetical protein